MDRYSVHWLEVMLALTERIFAMESCLEFVQVVVVAVPVLIECCECLVSNVNARTDLRVHAFNRPLQAWVDAFPPAVVVVVLSS